MKSTGEQLIDIDAAPLQVHLLNAFTLHCPTNATHSFPFSINPCYAAPSQSFSISMESPQPSIATLDAILHAIIASIPPSQRPSFLSTIQPRPAIKHYARPTPSQHCHICCRSAKNISVYSCARIEQAVCRKVVCHRCFVDHNWTWAKGWVCTHCKGGCPPRSQCFTYGKSNLKRRLKGKKRTLPVPKVVKPEQTNHSLL